MPEPRSVATTDEVDSITSCESMTGLHGISSGAPSHNRCLNELYDAYSTSGIEAVAPAIDLIAQHNIKNAALLTIDLFSRIRTDLLNLPPRRDSQLDPLEGYYIRSREALTTLHHRLFSSLECATPLMEEIRALPLIDAGCHLHLVENLPATIAYGKTIAMWEQWNQRELSSLSSSARESILLDISERSRIQPNEAGSMPVSPPLTTTHNISDPRAQILIEEFYQWAESTFPVASYGYHGVSAEIRGYLACLSVPTMASYDLGERFHQCFDTAMAAKDFFSSHGIPTEVCKVSLPGCSHVIAVAMFHDEAGTMIPVVIDGSPFRALLEAHPGLQSGATSSLAPTPALFERRKELSDFKYNIVMTPGGAYVPASGGTIPWCATVDPESGAYIIGMAGISKRLTHQERAYEPGTAEYCGTSRNLISTPLLSFTVLQKDGLPFGCSAILDRNPPAIVREKLLDAASPALLDAIDRYLQEPAARFLAFIEEVADRNRLPPSDDW